MTNQRAPGALHCSGDPHRFTGARARHNAVRRAVAEKRRVVVASLIADADLKKRGWMAAIAKQVGVSRWTIHRDFARIRLASRQQRAATARHQAIQQERFAAMVERATEGQS